MREFHSLNIIEHETTIINFNPISEFGLAIYKCGNNPEGQPELHNHDICEIYVHLAGDVTFVVENNIYAVSYGDIIITRPYENHHALYHNKNWQEHYCLFFHSDGNEYLFDPFFKREPGKNNLIVPNDQAKGKIISFCNTLLNKKLSELEKNLIFLNLIDIIGNSRKADSSSSELPDILIKSIDYISKNISRQITIKELAEINHISIATLERVFKEHIGFTPSKYILNQRLSLAESMLREENSVSDTANACGFSDDSTFIQTFKKSFGMTPLKYSKHSKRAFALKIF